MDFTQNYFDLLSVPQQFMLDKKHASENYRKLQKQFHPDNFVSQPANDQRLAVQFSAYVNTAHQTLLSPVSRAQYLLELAGHADNQQFVTIKDGMFLMMQMEWREEFTAISVLKDSELAEAQLGELEQSVRNAFLSTQALFEDQYEQQRFMDAKQAVAKLHFIEKMMDKIESLDSTLFD